MDDVLYWTPDPGDELLYETMTSAQAAAVDKAVRPQLAADLAESFVYDPSEFPQCPISRRLAIEIKDF